MKLPHTSEAFAPGCLPESVILPPRLLTTVSQGTSGMSLTWDLILKPVRVIQSTACYPEPTDWHARSDPYIAG